MALGVDHVSAYALTLDDPDEEGLTGPTGDHLPTTSGARRWRAGATVEQDEDRAAAQYRLAVERLGAAGFRGYEISNWARPGAESRHNLAYWRRRPVRGGWARGRMPSTASARRWNAARLDGYLAALVPPDGSVPSLPPGGGEVVGARRAAAERVILGLRLDEGLPEAEALAGPLAPHLAWAAEWRILERVAGPDGPRLRLTTEGRLLSNELFSRLV